MVWGLYFITGARINVYVPVRLVRGVPSVIAIAGYFVTDYQLFKLLSDQQLLFTRTMKPGSVKDLVDMKE